jgi:hypothetical protein
MKIFTKFVLIIGIISRTAFAQLSITNSGVNYTIDFDNTVAGVSVGQFTGTGFTPNPSSGQLDSDAWAVTGLSDGSLTFGGTATTGDFARGSSTGGVTTGGIYAFEVASGNRGLGIQPSDEDFTPGNLYLRSINNTGESILSFTISYKIYVLNNAPRANSLNFAYSLNYFQYYPISTLDFISTEIEEPSPVWTVYNRNETVSGINIENGEYLYFRWRGEDETGSLTRDEFAIDDIVISVTTTNQTIVFFNSTFLEVNEGDGIFSISLNIQNAVANPTQVDLVLIDATTYSADLNGYTSQTITFPANNGDDQSVIITLTDDIIIEGIENLILELQNVTGGNSAFIGNPYQFNLTIRDNDAYDIIINEIHADPDPDNGDANNDGLINSGQDEFVELINNEFFDVDITGWKLNDAQGLKHIFPTGSIIPASQSLVVFGGGTPTGIPGVVQTTGAGFLGLNNGGDSVFLLDLLNIIADSYTYGVEGGENESLARNPDINGNFIKHSDISNNPVRYSPGRRNIDGTPLPVELTSFSASVVGNTVKLNWKTETEVNNYGFDVERNTPLNPLSRGEAEGRGVWEKIGFVNGNGNSNSPKSYSFTDANVLSGKYSYRLKQIDNDGQFEYSKTIEVDLGAPTKFELSQNYPNPFNPVTKIKYTIPNVTLSMSSRAESRDEGSLVVLKVYDVLGNEVTTLVNEEKPAGVYEVEFSSVGLASGIYFYRIAIQSDKLQSGSFVETKKMIIMK